MSFIIWISSFWSKYHCLAVTVGWFVDCFHVYSTFLRFRFIVLSEKQLDNRAKKAKTNKLIFDENDIIDPKVKTV